jgi:hypothetical protein
LKPLETIDTAPPYPRSRFSIDAGAAAGWGLPSCRACQRRADGSAEHIPETALATAAFREHMADRAGAHVTRVKAGHLSLITRPADVVKVILAAVAATT